jgi:hypothetical protein
MLYALLCFNCQDTVFSWTQEEDDAVMARLETVHQKLAAQGRLGPAARLGPTTTAKTLRKEPQPPLVVDGPYAETKEALLGFYLVDCASMDEALEVARELEKANPGRGAYEVRPVIHFVEGVRREVEAGAAA